MGIFSKEPAQVESFEAETVVSVDVNGLLNEAERMGVNVTRETLGGGNREDVQMRKNIAAWAEELPGLSRTFYARLAIFSPDECGAEEKGQLQVIRGRLRKKDKALKAILQEMWGDGYSEAPQRLRTAFTRDVAMSSMPLRTSSGRFLSAPGQVFDISPGVAVPAALPVAAAGSALRKPKNWGRKREPERELAMFKYYVSLGDERCHAKVAEKYKMSSSNVNMIACDWSWSERIGILEAEQALMANATRTDDISDALRAAGIGVAREILKKIVIDKTTGMITGVEGINISDKGGLGSALRLVGEIRDWLGEGNMTGSRGRGPGGSKGGGMLGRPVLNFIIKK
jgi:hypothetical protein